MDITLSKQATKALSALDKLTRKRIIAGVYKPPAGDVEKLNHPEHSPQKGTLISIMSYDTISRVRKGLFMSK